MRKADEVTSVPVDLAAEITTFGKKSSIPCPRKTLHILDRNALVHRSFTKESSELLSRVCKQPCTRVLDSAAALYLEILPIYVTGDVLD